MFVRKKSLLELRHDILIYIYRICRLYMYTYLNNMICLYVFTYLRNI